MPYGDPVPPAGINTGPYTAIFHSGAYPRLSAIEYHPNGSVKRIELREV